MGTDGRVDRCNEANILFCILIRGIKRARKPTEVFTVQFCDYYELSGGRAIYQEINC